MTFGKDMREWHLDYVQNAQSRLKLSTPSFALFNHFYNEPFRAYHNFDHIYNLLVLHSILGGELTRPKYTAVETAIWYHDIIYNPGATNNEEASALLFKSFAELGSLHNGATTDLIVQTILDTKHLQEPKNKEPWSLYMLDLDLAGLASDPEQFTKNTRAIEEESNYSMKELVPLCCRYEFVKNRIRFWTALLDRGYIYHNPYKLPMLKTMDKQARVNINKELEQLKQKYNYLHTLGFGCE